MFTLENNVKQQKQIKSVSAIVLVVTLCAVLVLSVEP